MKTSELVAGELHDFLTEMTRNGPGWPLKASSGQKPLPEVMKEAIQLSLFAQIISCQHDVSETLKRGSLHSANTLQRTQMDSIIRIAWLENHQDNALWYLAAWEVDAQRRTELAIKGIIHLSDKALTAATSAIETSKKRLAIWLLELPDSSPALATKGKLKRLPKICEMATQAKLLDFYRTYYSHGSEFVHTGAVALNPYFSIENRAAVIQPTYSADDLNFAWKNIVYLLWRCVELRRDIGWTINAKRYNALRSRIGQA